MPEVIFIGLSGPSSSGKTSLAHILHHLLPNSTILHADDFCKEFDDIPTINGYLDCDGPDGVDFIRMAEVIDYMKGHSGATPDGFNSWQDEVFPGQPGKALQLVPPRLMESMRVRSGQMRELAGDGLTFPLKVVFLEGFLLFHNPRIREHLDLRLFLPLSYATAQERRFTRQGYGPDARPGEFWKTKDYFEKVVWRNYATYHAALFDDGDVEGAVNAESCAQLGIKVLPHLDPPVEVSLPWAMEQIVESIMMLSS